MNPQQASSSAGRPKGNVNASSQASANSSGSAPQLAAVAAASATSVTNSGSSSSSSSQVRTGGSSGDSQQPSKMQQMQVMRMQQTKLLMKWMQDMLIQIRKELETIAFRCLLQIYLEQYKAKDNQPELLSFLSGNIGSSAQYFLNFEFKRHIEVLAKQLYPNRLPQLREQEEAKTKELTEKYHDVHISQYAYETIYCFLNENVQTADFCRDVTQRYVKKRVTSHHSTIAKMGSSSLGSSSDHSQDYKFVTQIDKEDQDIQCDFLNSFEEINLFHKLEVVKKDKVKINEIHVFQKAYEHLDSSASALMPEARPKSNLVYSVMEKSLMINDFLERKHIEGEHSHPSILKMRIDDPNESITCVEISKGGNIILCGTSDSQIYLFDVGQYEAVDKTGYADSTNFFSNIGTNATTADDASKQSTNSASVASNSVAIKFRAKFLGHEDAITSISVLYNENYFISSSIDLSIRLWDIRLNICLNIYKGHLKTIWNVKFANQGFLFGSCSADKTAMLWTTNKSSIMKVLIGHTKDVTAIDFCENLDYAITASLDQTIRFWKIRSGQCALSLELSSPVTSMHFSYSGYYFVTGQENGDIRLWNMLDLKQIKCVNLQSEINRDAIYSVHISFDESTLTVNTQKHIAYYNLNSLKSIQGENIYEDFYIGKEKFNQKIEANRFYPIEPKEIFEIPKIQTEKYLKSYMHMRNFIIAISKQTL